MYLCHPITFLTYLRFGVNPKQCLNSASQAVVYIQLTYTQISIHHGVTWQPSSSGSGQTEPELSLMSDVCGMYSVHLDHVII